MTRLWVGESGATDDVGVHGCTMDGYGVLAWLALGRRLACPRRRRLHPIASSRPPPLLPILALSSIDLFVLELAEAKPGGNTALILLPQICINQSLPPSKGRTKERPSRLGKSLGSADVHGRRP